MNKLQLKIGIVGCVSVGKTTLVNSIFGYQYSDTEIHRTTFIPQTYQETLDVHISHSNKLDQCDDDDSSSHKTIGKNSDDDMDNYTNIETHNHSHVSSIRMLNRKSNQMIAEAIQIGSTVFPTHNVPKISNFIDSIHSEQVLLSITDYPGIEKLSGPYLDLVKQHIQSMDIIIFMSDLSKALMTFEELNILTFLLGLSSKNNSRIICLLNKCDQIYHDEKQNDLVFTDSEQERIFIKANSILSGLIKTSNISHDRCTPFIPISSEIAFIYRAMRKYTDTTKRCLEEVILPATQEISVSSDDESEDEDHSTCPQVENPCFEGVILSTTHDRPFDETYINKLCIYEYGSNQWKKNYENIRNMSQRQILGLFDDKMNCSQKIVDSGFNVFENILRYTIDTYEKEFFIHKVDNIISVHSVKKNITSNDIIAFINDNYDFIKICDQRYNFVEIRENSAEIQGNCQLIGKFWTSVNETLKQYTNYIKNININIVIDNRLTSFSDFDSIHTNLQTEFLYFKNLIETIKKYEDKTKDIIDITIPHQTLTNKICILYEQLITYSDETDCHTHFSNILQYLVIIKEYLPEKFDKLSIRFLDIFNKKINILLNGQSSNKDHETKLIEVIDYIHDNISDASSLYKKLTYMLIFKHMYMITNFPADVYWYHMVMLKSHIKKIRKDRENRENRQNISSKSKYFVDIIYEITTKYIRDQLTDKGMFNVYRQEINMELVSALLRTPDKYDLTQLNPFEQKIMDILFKI